MSSQNLNHYEYLIFISLLFTSTDHPCLLNLFLSQPQVCTLLLPFLVSPIAILYAEQLLQGMHVSHLGQCAGRLDVQSALYYLKAQTADILGKSLEKLDFVYGLKTIRVKFYSMCLDIRFPKLS